MQIAPIFHSLKNQGSQIGAGGWQRGSYHGRMEIGPLFCVTSQCSLVMGVIVNRGGRISTAHLVPVGLIPTNSYEPYSISWERCVELKIESSYAGCMASTLC